MVGINLKEKTVYICEVAIHLITGLQYTKGTSPNNVQKLTQKLGRDIEYANAYFSEYKKHVMLWTPIVKNSNDKSKHNQTRDIEKIKSNITTQYGIEVEFVMNEKFLSCIQEMRGFASTETAELKCPVMRLLHIEERLKRHVTKING